MSKINWSLIGAIVVVCALIVSLYSVKVYAHDPHHAEDNAWYDTLMQPDAPHVPCCGEADAYYADSYEVQGDQYVAIITDERDDRELGKYGRVHVPVGTRVVIPNHKLKFDKGNPTGHGIVFMNAQQHVFCYIQPGGV